jgi:hypothetical protein
MINLKDLLIHFRSCDLIFQSSGHQRFLSAHECHHIRGHIKMRVALRRLFLLQLVSVSLLPVLVFGQQVGLSAHQRNVSDCRNGWESCEPSTLTQAETIVSDVKHSFRSH